jgi:hypothetical protein
MPIMAHLCKRSIFGISGGVEVNGVPWLTLKPAGEIAAIVVGFCFIGFGTYLILRDALQQKKPDASPEKGSGFLLPSEAFGPNTNISETLAQTSTIYILGYSFVGLLGGFNDSLTKAVSNGANVKIVIINPNKQAIKVIEAEVLKSKLKNGTITLEEVKSKAIQKAKKIFRSREDIEGALSYARSIARRSKGVGTGRIEVRLIDWIPSCSMIFLNPDRKDGRLILGIYTPYFNLATENRPHVLLTHEKDTHWYKSYLHQFNTLWEESDDNVCDLFA